MLLVHDVVDSRWTLAVVDSRWTLTLADTAGRSVS